MSMSCKDQPNRQLEPKENPVCVTLVKDSKNGTKLENFYQNCIDCGVEDHNE